MHSSDIAPHRTRVRNARDGARNIAKALHSELGAVSIMTDPNLSDEGNAKQRAEAAKSKRELAAHAARQIREELAETRSYVSAAADRLVSIPDDPASLIRAEQRWNQVKARLEGGEQLPSIVRTADSVTVRAIIEHAPSYMMARGRKEDFTTILGRALASTPDTQFEDIRREVQAQAVPRLADLSTDVTDRAILEVYAGVDSAMESAEPWLSAIESMSSGHAVNMLDVAIQDAALMGSNRVSTDEEGAEGRGA